MNQSLAYHVVVHSLEGRGGWTPASRFASAVAHVNNGHLPYARHHAAGRARAIEGSTDGQIERAVREFLLVDVTPGVRVILGLSTPAVVVAGFNAYNASAGIAVRTNVALRASGESGPVVARREMRVEAEDPHACRVGTLAMFEGLISAVELNARMGIPARRPTLSALADMLGARGSASAEAALIFETEGAMPIAELARRLGCHQRSLERKLRAEGQSADALRQAVRMMRATDRLGSADSLTTIAIEEGFSDLSHMTRSFKTAAGLQPSLLRKLLWADSEALSKSKAAEDSKLGASAL